ncbi:hypothetical protein OHB14_50040 [Streptomyces sp. NBC_01613]|uniref:hypothetical protein n=1 Tax=Streptomyces sp. NBC_01613 TaxID=2975896 RepID=UPI00386A7B30
MSSRTERTAVVAPTMPATGMGTVVGAAEILDRRNRVLDRFPLRADRPHTVELRVGERFLLRGWSPYVSLRRTLVTGGDPTARLATDATPETWPSDRGRRSTSGWLCLWQGPRNGDDTWVPLPPSALRDAEVDAPAVVPIGTAERPLAVQVGGGNRAPACTLVPPGVPLTVDPVEGLAGTRLALRPVADSGYTLLEALRRGESLWAGTVAQAWDGPQPPAGSIGESTLFDLAIAYLRCSQGDVDSVDEWLSSRSDPRRSRADAGDISALSIWVARRRGRRGSHGAEWHEALDHWALPLTGEGLGLLYEDLIRESEPSRHIEERVMPLMAAAHPSALLTYTAPEPGKPKVSVRQRDRSPHGPVRTFRLAPKNDSGLRLTLERSQTPTEFWERAAMVAAREEPRRTEHRLDIRCGPRRVDRDLMWELARLVVDVAVHDGELRFTTPDHVIVPLTGVPRSARDRLVRIVEEWWFGAGHVGTLTLTTPTGSVLLDQDSDDASGLRTLPELLRADED